MNFTLKLSLLLSLIFSGVANAQLVTHRFAGVMTQENELYNIGDTYEGSYTLEASAPTYPVGANDVSIDTQSSAIWPTYPGTGWSLTVESTKIAPFSLSGSYGTITLGNDMDVLGNGTNIQDRYLATLYGTGISLPEGLSLSFFQIDFGGNSDLLPSGTIDVVPVFANAWRKGGRFFSSSPTCPQCRHLVTSFGNTPPIADAGADIVAECAGSTTEVALDGTKSLDPDGDLLTFEWSAPEGVSLDEASIPTPTGSFPAGESILTLTVTDESGSSSSDEVKVTVVDTLPPVVNCSTDIIVLFPPDRSMQTVQVSIIVSDICESAADLSVTCRVASSEPDAEAGGNSLTGDVNGEDGFTEDVTITNLQFSEETMTYSASIALRAERSGIGGTGRTYTIKCTAEDSSGNESSTSCAVAVPLAPRGKPNK